MQVYCCEVCTLWNKIRNTAASSAICRESIRPSYCHYDIYWIKKVLLWARKSHSFPTSKTRITMPARNGQHTEQYATFCTLEWGHFYCSLCWALPHPREGVLLPGSIFGRCCTKCARLQRGVCVGIELCFHLNWFSLIRVRIILVEVGLRAQNAIWNVRAPRDHKHLHNKVLSCCLPFTCLWPQARSQ